MYSVEKLAADPKINAWAPAARSAEPFGLWASAAPRMNPQAVGRGAKRRRTKDVRVRLRGEHGNLALVDVEAGHAQILDFHLVTTSYQSTVGGDDEPLGAVEGNIAGDGIVLEVNPRVPELNNNWV